MFKRLIPTLFLIMTAISTAYASEQDVIQALSVKDSLGSQTSSLQELENLAGGKDQLIQILLKHRRTENPAFVAIRAENLLLNYTDNEEVTAALEQDINDTKYFGLARTITANIDQVSNPSAKQRLAKAAVARAKSEKRFENYGRMLKESTDANVSRLAKDL